MRDKLRRQAIAKLTYPITPRAGRHVSIKLFLCSECRRGDIISTMMLIIVGGRLYGRCVN